MNRNQKYFLKQRLMGALEVLIGVLSIWMMDGNPIGAIILVPIGLTMLFSKEKVLTEGEFFEEEYEENEREL